MKNTKKSYIDGLRSIGKKVDFVTVFTNITGRGALPEEASNYTAKKMTALKEL